MKTIAVRLVLLIAVIAIAAVLQLAMARFIDYWMEQRLDARSIAREFDSVE